MTTATRKTWTHKVYKQSRGGQGEWFSYPTAFTGTEEACQSYAERFLAEQLEHLKGSMGHRIVVATRGGKIAKVYRYDDK